MSDYCKVREVHDTGIVVIAADFSPVLHALSKECPWNVLLIDVFGLFSQKNVINATQKLRL